MDRAAKEPHALGPAFDVKDAEVLRHAAEEAVKRLDPAGKQAIEAVTHTIDAGRMAPKNKT